ncbi:MAG: hypothetical protein A2017_09225 [Lentisphaerae bacterium GWF2_44_16]|nr:MAG: hypothetical protein A2017_09225 [Lentisphaerae bacterium GWF2_44_16]
MNTLVKHDSADPKKLFGSMLSHTAEILGGSKSGISRISLFKELNKAMRTNANNTGKIKLLLEKINTPGSKQYLSRINSAITTNKRSINA